ncbi:hypothetical protein FBY51_0242 [Zymomonas mobilis]|uniref:transcriptional regulator n=1 Tax=Zymomonas mobilis TaxID=542 RepID=UPI00026D8295|nr:transcriptional regulator [Zymomonas mobilis]AFN56479.1 hypothetical protein ZZ6_0581 [Zymomonas mobilis subsp. mobilis ATCC 29191]TQK78090.1 hypothetical protein FBY53_0746 [Zymomonas mobilis]TQL15264.1 hypothetical protein FBY51_0242 [Zymomonas mobilis]
MPSPCNKLKLLRKAAKPPITIRALAEAIDMPASSYAFYEDMNRFKKKYLPLELTRKIATVLMNHQINPEDILALSGLTSYELKTEISAIRQIMPPIQFVKMNMALPNETLLAEMFEDLLADLDLNAPKKEIAHNLAQHLPEALSETARKIPDKIH